MLVYGVSMGIAMVFFAMLNSILACFQRTNKNITAMSISAIIMAMVDRPHWKWRLSNTQCCYQENRLGFCNEKCYLYELLKVRLNVASYKERHSNC